MFSFLPSWIKLPKIYLIYSKLVGFVDILDGNFLLFYIKKYF